MTTSEYQAKFLSDEINYSLKYKDYIKAQENIEKLKEVLATIQRNENESRTFTNKEWEKFEDSVFDLLNKQEKEISELKSRLIKLEAVREEY